MKQNNNLSRVTGLRGYQGEFTFSGLEEHLFSELRRFRTGKDETHERDLVKVFIFYTITLAMLDHANYIYVENLLELIMILKGPISFMAALNSGT